MQISRAEGHTLKLSSFLVVFWYLYLDTCNINLNVSDPVVTAPFHLCNSNVPLPPIPSPMDHHTDLFQLSCYKQTLPFNPSQIASIILKLYFKISNRLTLFWYKRRANMSTAFLEFWSMFKSKWLHLSITYFAKY